MLNIGVIGAGRIGSIHAQNVAAHPSANLSLVADPFPGSAEKLANLAAKISTDPAEVINDPEVDAIIICSPTPTHVELILAGVQAGKAILCEKPVDLDVNRANECLAEVTNMGGRVMIGFNRRFDPTFAEIRNRVAAGEIGALEQLTIISRDPAPPSPAYVASSGGMFKDMTIHDFDLARFFLGKIVSVQAIGQNVVDPAIKDAGDIDAAAVLLKAASGTVASIWNSRRCVYGYDQRVEAFGSLGMLQANNQRANSVVATSTEVTAAGSPYLDFFLERYADAYRLELDSFITSIVDGAGFSPTLADGCEALILAAAAQKSHETGQIIPID